MITGGSLDRDLDLSGGDFNIMDDHDDGGNPSPAGGFDAMDEDKDIWGVSVSAGGDTATTAASAAATSILGDDPSLFYTDFPPLPEFPCMSSSSSSPPSAAAVEIPSTDIEQVMENLSYIDLIDTSDMWDPSSVFQTTTTEDEDAHHHPPPPSDDGGGLAGFLQGNSELAAIFFEWLKQNRDYISAEDMRNIKLRRSTIESAAKRLGSNKEGKKQLLKLILDWVEHHQLQKRRYGGGGYCFANPNPNPNPVAYSPFNPLTPDPNSCFSPAPWAPSPMGGGYPNPTSFMPMNNNNNNNHQQQVVNGIPYMDPAQSWPVSSPPLMPQYNPYPDNQFQGLYGINANNNYQMYDIPNGGVRLGAAATKEARKRRMARQRRMHSHHHSSRQSGSNSSRSQIQTSDVSVGDGGGEEDGEGSLGNFGYWSSTDGLQTATGDQESMSSDRRQQQGWKMEKNFKFLLQKVLKQSDVGNLGRIVLPKKEAESHLPELETRDGITIAMEDIVTKRVWNIRYRFWPNNKSRMYLLENTGEFVRSNGLQEGDFIVLYLDTKCDKYMIRGVKVRQPGTKLPEAKKPALRRNTRNVSVAAGNNTFSSPVHI